MRFARDLASLAGVVDEAAYYAGAIYPDSRYLTGVSREQTHRIDVPTFPFTNDQTDFQKGWATHLLYDDLAGARLKSFFCVEEIGDFDQRWMKTTAAKVVEELYTCQTCPEVLEIIRGVEMREAPLNESWKTLEVYYRVQRDTYKKTPKTLEDFHRVHGLLSDEMIAVLASEVQALQKDAEATKRIQFLYNEVLSEIL